MKQRGTLLQEALAIARIGCWEWDLQTNQLNCTEEVFRLFGLDARTAESGYEPFLALVHERELPLVKQTLRQALQDKRLTRVDFCITRPDGAICALEVKGQVREDESRKALTFTGTIQDITPRKEAEKVLLTREKQYYLIAESVPAMVWTSFPDDNLNYVNSWMVNYTGLPVEQLLAKGWLEVVHPDDREVITAALASSLQSKEPYRIEIRMRRADGSYRWHIRHALPIKDEEENVKGWIGINTDIQEQKLKEEILQENEALREAQQNLRTEKEFSEAILDNSLNGILAFNSHGRITKWNKHMEFLSGRKKEEALGKTLVEVFPEYIEREEGKAVEKALQGEYITLRNKNNPFNLSDGIYEISLMPLLIEGEIAGGLGTIYEVTEIIKLEKEQTNLKLGQQKEVLNAILRTQERERERISESLHNGIGQLLFAARLNLQTVKSKQLPAEIGATLTKVNDLMNEAIRQSRSVSFELVPIALKDFGLQATLEDLAQTLSSPALTIAVQVTGLEKRLEKFLELTTFRIIQALLINVMEHAQATEAMVRISAIENNLVIQVTDNGKGFDPDTAPANAKEGNLQSVRNRVALLNGNINIDSAMAKGTTVSINIPLTQQT